MDTALWAPDDPVNIVDSGRAEDLAELYMQWSGFEDARRLPEGADGGIDIASSSALAQVKLKKVNTGRPDLQRLYGARADDHHRTLVFFSVSDYAKPAREYAERVGTLLFQFDREGHIWPVNGTARQLHNEAIHRHEERLRALAQREAAMRELLERKRQLSERAAAERQEAVARRRAARAARRLARARMGVASPVRCCFAVILGVMAQFYLFASFVLMLTAISGEVYPGMPQHASSWLTLSLLLGGASLVLLLIPPPTVRPGT